MIHIAREVRNPDEEVVTMTVVFDLNGVHIIRKDSNGEMQTVLYTHEEANAICDLLDLARPAYIQGMTTP